MANPENTDETDFEQEVLNRLDKLTTEVERFDEKFTLYQKATQWVVQLAFTLIASATIAILVQVIITVIRR